uniref:Uncharacterized protein n=1 Tax=Rhizophora mucronata TaxID=61149 RepID=A0A2P2PLS6_RHIMU
MYIGQKSNISSRTSLKLMTIQAEYNETANLDCLNARNFSES